ncbi:hypothetical protein [Microvirga makkahensis]|nr:hypothetical protein [Microvirga makkahensis]
MAQDQSSSTGQWPEHESDEYAEWQIRSGGVMVLRLDRKTGIGLGEWERVDPDAPDHREPHTISPEEARALARARDLRFRDGTKAT